LLASRDDPAVAEQYHARSIALARQHRAKFELRMQRALACAAKANEQKPDLRGPIYHRFKEGFDTPDLHEARTALDELA
jgi:hypothetical protein